MPVSSYIKPNRLNDLIAAIPVLAINDSYKRTAKGWTKIITGVEDNSEYWKSIFEEHSEFFRKTEVGKGEETQGDKGEEGEEGEEGQGDKGDSEYSLVMRRGVSSRYHKILKKVVTPEEYLALSKEEKNKLTRSPLSDDRMKMLIDLAVTLHDQAIAAQQDRRWWFTPVLSLIGSFGGALFGHFAAHH